MAAPVPNAPPPFLGSSTKTVAAGRYVLVRKLAEGGTATVHLGYDTVDHQWRAIKTLLPDYARRPALRHRFELEGRTMQELEHPNIIRVFEAGQDGDTAWLVMEYAEGGSVIDWVERHGRMPPKMACKLILGLCDGIRYAHERGVVHRDIKPQNALVDGHGVCKVTDFGIAQVIQETRMTMTGTVMGTIGYMAPEQHESAKHADQRADVYSIAATLYTLLAGEAPTHLFMADESDFETLPRVLAEVIRKGSQYRREARYESVAEMAVSLRHALDRLPDDPPDTPPVVAESAIRLDQLTPPTLGTVDPERRPFELSGSTAGSGSGRNELAPSNAAPIVTVPPVVPRHEEPLPQEETRLTRKSLTGDTAPRLVDRTRTSRENLDRAEWRRKVLAVVAVVLALVLAIGGGTFGVGAWRIAQWENLVDNAAHNLYLQVHQERTLLDVLRPLDIAQFAELQSLYDQVETGDAEQKEEATLRLVATLDQVRRSLENRGITREEHAVKQLAESTRRLQERLAEQQRMERQVLVIRGSMSGWVATMLGV